MSAPTILVVAKAPVPGLAKTRVAAVIGDAAAAEIAAAALLDTLEIAGSLGWRVVVAMTGDLGVAARCEEITAALVPFTVIAQRGSDFARRLVAAHHDADTGFGVVQIGMDTPQLTAADLRAAGRSLGEHDAALGLADDGGWWLLALRDPAHADGLAAVPMSRSDTGRRTVDALTDAGADLVMVRSLADLDTWEDARALAARHPHLRTSKVVGSR